MTDSENNAGKLLELYQCASNNDLDPYERYQASEKAFDLIQTTQWDDRCGIPGAQAYFIFLVVKLEFELVNSYLECGEELDGLIKACEDFLPLVLDPYAQCHLLENLAKLYITRIKENTVEYLSEALTAIQELPRVDGAGQSHHKVALIFIITELLKEKLFNFTKQPEYITSPNHIEEALQTCISSEDEQVIFEASQMVGEYYLLSLQGKRVDNVERALEIFLDQKSQAERSDFGAPEFWCKICEKLGDAYAVRIKGNRYKNIKKAADFYNTAAGIAEEAPLDKYPEKQKTLNTLKTADMLIERNKLGDSYYAIMLITKESNAVTQEKYQNSCYLYYVNARTCNVPDKHLFKQVAFKSLSLMEATIHFECSARFHYEAKILAATVILQSRHAKRKNLLEQSLVEFEGILKGINSDIFPIESIKMHILCGGVLKELSRASYQPQLLHYEAALGIAKEYDLAHHLAIIYLRIGEIYASRNSHVFDTNQAIEHYRSSIKFIKKKYQIDIFMEAKLYLIAAYCVAEDWKAASVQSMDILDFIDTEKRPQEIEQVFKIINQTNASLFASLMPYVHLMLGDIKKGLASFERLKIESIHHKLLYETIYPKDEDFLEAINLYYYQLMAKHVITGQALTYEMKMAAEHFLKNAQSVPLEYQKKYGFSLELKDIDEQLSELEEWVLLPIITPVDTYFILLAPHGKKQQIIISEPAGVDITHFSKIFASWIDVAIFALKEEGSDGAKKFDEVVTILPQLLYLAMGKWIGQMIIEHAIPKNDRLIIIPSHLIANLPLGLTAIFEDGTFLQDYFTLSIAPSITAINGIRKRFQDFDLNETTLTHVHVPEENLEHGTLERSVISSFLNESCIQNIEATDTESLFSIPEFFDSTYLHLQLHGQYHFTYSEESSLSLTSGNSLNSADLVRMAPKQYQRVVTLTSCEAGTADIYKSVGTLHNFPAIMMLTGAIGVIAPIWEVNNSATCILMIRFYENHFAKKTSPPQALKDAQLWMKEATTDDIIQYIEDHTKRNGASISEEANKLIFELEKIDPDEKPFAAPQYWAAFVYFGL